MGASVKANSSKNRKIKEYVWTFTVLVLLVLIAAMPDIIYYNCPNIWMSNQKFMGRVCVWLWRKGINYKGLLEILKNNFGILVTSISIILTINIQSLNRSEGRAFGLKRAEFDFSKRWTVYKYARRIVFCAPFIMIVAIILNACILGYFVLILCYLFIIMAYLLFESSFTPEADWNRIVQKMCADVPEDIRDYDDTVLYRMLLNRMRHWNDREEEWEGAHYLFEKLLYDLKGCSIKKRYILCCLFYEQMYVRNCGTNCERAVYELTEYITKKDRYGWDEDSYALLWGMLHQLLTDGNSRCIFSFFKWYMDFTARYQKLSEKSLSKDDINDFDNRANDFMQHMSMQTGILLIEFEGYLNRHIKREEISSEAWAKLPVLWENGKGILAEQNSTFREKYREYNRSCNLHSEELETWLKNLKSDFQYGTERSLVVCYLKMIRGDSDGNHM